MNQVIWTYWHNAGDLSDLHADYLHTWNTKNCPGWDIRILTDENIEQYIDINMFDYKRCGHAAYSDLVRLYLLGRYGGLWMDASIALHKPLHVLISDYTKITVFKLNSRHYVESWFMYAPMTLRGVFQSWFQELKTAMDVWPNIETHRSYRDIPVQVDKPIEYFMVYQTFLFMRKTNKTFADAFNIACIHPVTWEMLFMGNSWLGCALVKTTHKTRWLYRKRHSLHVFVLLLCALLIMRLLRTIV